MTVKSTQAIVITSELDNYLAKIRQYPVLSREEEMFLARKWRDEGDVNAAHTLVTSNLRFVVKIAREYKGYGASLMDLIQEGSVGLMQGVRRFDPEKGYKLISYAVFWIRSYIHNYLMATNRMVKIGTSRAHRKLFFKLRSFKALLGSKGVSDESQILDEAAKAFNTSRDEIEEMNSHLAAADASLDAPSKETGTAMVEFMPSQIESQEDILSQMEQEAHIEAKIGEALESLNEREQLIVKERYLTESPVQLKDIGNKLGVSKQRVAQIEKKALLKLREQLVQAA